MFHLLVLFTVDDEPYGENIEDAFERHLLLLHFAVDGQGSLGPNFQLVVNPVVRELLLERLNEAGHQFLTVGLGALELVGDGSVLLRFSIPEIDVFHLAFDVV